MKWDDKHNKAKEVIGRKLGEAELWLADKDLISGLSEEEVGEVNAELTAMLDSICKRYKIERTKPEPKEEEPKEEKPKRTRKPRAKKSDKEV